MSQPLVPPGQPHAGAGQGGGAAAPPGPGVGDPSAHLQASPGAGPHHPPAYASPAVSPYAAAPYPPQAGAGGPPSGTFGLALAGAILGSVALLLSLVTLVMPMLFLGGWDEGEFGDEVGFEEVSPTGTLPAPDDDGYTSAEVTTAVVDALDSYVYPMTAQCPAISASMAQDLEGRTVVCEGDDDGWTMTVIVVFSDGEGAFSATPY